MPFFIYHNLPPNPHVAFGIAQKLISGMKALFKEWDLLPRVPVLKIFPVPAHWRLTTDDYLEAGIRTQDLEVRRKFTEMA